MRTQLCVCLASLAIQMTAWKDVLSMVGSAVGNSADGGDTMLDFLRILTRRGHRRPKSQPFSTFGRATSHSQLLSICAFASNHSLIQHSQSRKRNLPIGRQSFSRTTLPQVLTLLVSYSQSSGKCTYRATPRLLMLAGVASVRTPDYMNVYRHG